MPSPFLIYGANGFTGRLVARQTKSLGLAPILAGRTGPEVGALGQELGLPTRCFGLDAIPQLETPLVLNCAGPFSRTAPLLMEACLAQGIHYLDITGELAVFETAHGKGDRARERGLVLMPGVGFDVVPTDCLALSLKERMPDATHLELAFFAKSPPSVGTVKTMLENIPKGGCERVNGRLVPVPMFHKVKRVKFRTRELDCAAIPWGDLATAFYSTGIPNIVVYSVHPPGFVALSKLVNPVKGLMGLAPVQRLLKAGVQRLIRGPSPEQQANSTIEIWGRVSGPTGELEDRIEVCEGYRFTAEVALECVKRVLAMELKGYFTPAQAFGSGLLRETGHLL